MATTEQKQNGELWSSKTIATSEVTDIIRIPEINFDYGVVEVIVSSGTATLEYTLATQKDLDDGVAVFTPYLDGNGNGTFTTALKVEDTFSRGITGFRLTAIAGTSTMVVKI